VREWQPHSFEKISIFTDYIAAFVKAAQRASNRVYIDAFAGDTINVLRTTGESFPSSAEIALGVEPPFTYAALFETDRRRADRLRDLAARYPSRDVDVFEGDSNALMQRALAKAPVQAPTFAFLDPDGMELEWRTVTLLADHKRGKSPYKIEMWILLSTSGLVRMLGDFRDPQDAERNERRVHRLYGARGPWERVREARRSGELTAEETRQAYMFLYMDRLAGLGYANLLARPIHNSRGELYVMIFATDHPSGSTIMRWAQEQPRVVKRAPVLFEVPEDRPLYEDLHTGWRDDLPFELPPWEELDWR
jgi:three-Cys-motif partner protein